MKKITLVCLITSSVLLMTSCATTVDTPVYGPSYTGYNSYQGYTVGYDGGGYYDGYKPSF